MIIARGTREDGELCINKKRTLTPLLHWLFFPILEPESAYPPDDNDAACKKALCECDSKAAQCFAQSSFNTSYIDYDTAKC